MKWRKAKDLGLIFVVCLGVDISACGPYGVQRIDRADTMLLESGRISESYPSHMDQ